MANRPMVSIIIPTHDRLDKLTNLLLDLDLQTWPLDRFKVHVVDDGSLENPGPELSQLPLRYTCELIHVPAGTPARGRNLALQRAGGDIILFLNDDVRAYPELIEAHVEAHGQHPDELVAVLGTLEFSDYIRRDLFCRVLEDENFVVNTRRFADGSYHHFRDFRTGNLSLPRAAAEAVGGFDERFNDALSEDLDLGLRLERELAVRLFFTERARCLNDHQHTVEQWRARNRMRGRNSYLLHKKHHNLLDLTSWERNGALSSEKLQEAWELYETQKSAMEQVQAMVELVVTQDAVEEPLSGKVSFGGEQSFELPRDN